MKRVPRSPATAAVAAVTGLILLLLAPQALLAGPARGADEPAALTEPLDVSDAQLRWGINNETNNRAFAPGTFNFMSAGIVPNPGRGGTTIAQKDWQAQSGTVRIEKQQAGGSYALATWAGLTTTPQGSQIASPTSGAYSNHQVVLSGGVGSVDPTTGFATIAWTGSFTVLYYSGMSFFTVTDPTLTVTPERAQLTATLGGFASDMDDQTRWEALAPAQAVLADLPRDQVDLAGAAGFAVTPAYLGVDYAAPSDGAAQVGGPFKGAFPTTFLNFLSTAGSAAYWYSTGGATDAQKPALPLSVSYAGATVPTSTPSSASPTKKPTKKPTRKPTATPTRSPSSGATPPAPPVRAPAPPTAPMPPPALPVSNGPAPAVQPALALGITPVLVTSQSSLAPPASAASAVASAAPQDSEQHALWLLGCVLLLGALALTLISIRLEGTR